MTPDQLLDQAVALHRTGRKAESRAVYLAILKENPDHPAALSNLALLVREEGNPELARKLLGHSLHLDPRQAEGWSNLGLLLIEEDRPEAAIEALERALLLKPGLLDALRNLALALHEAGRLGESLPAYERALSLAPADADLRWGRACLLLLMGDFARGWEDYEARRNIGGASPPQATGPEWSLSAPSPSRVLVHAEQGFGDTMHFLRFVRPLIERGHEIELRVQDRIVRLLKSSPLLDGVGISGFSAPLPEFDYQTPLLSLPRVLGMNFADLAIQGGYLAAEPERVEKWRNRLPQGFKIGIAWQGTPKVAVDRGRSIPLREFRPLIGPGVNLISLQKHNGLEQLAEMPEVIDLGPDFDPGPDYYLDTAAVMECLDLIVTSDTSAAHLAGALGRPTWLALKKTPDWRWLMERQDCPSYPSMRLFRQEKDGDWNGVFTRMAHELAILLGP